MAIDYVRRVLAEPAPQIPSFEVKEIAKIVGTTVTGTELRNVPDINRALERSIPSVEFVVDYVSHDFREIEEELAHYRPVIPWLFIREAGREYEHTLVVRGYEPQQQLIDVNDPQRGNGRPTQMPITQFIEEWEGTERMLIKLKVGARIQRRLTEYMEKYATRVEEVFKVVRT